jgi:hypothetical protein
LPDKLSIQCVGFRIFQNPIVFLGKSVCITAELTVHIKYEIAHIICRLVYDMRYSYVFIYQARLPPQMLLLSHYDENGKEDIIGDLF